jgi:hypothetical protein
MAAPSWGAPPSGYQYGQGHGGNQQMAAPPPQGTAVAVTAASNGVGNPYVVVTPAPAIANPSPCQSTCISFESVRLLRFLRILTPFLCVAAVMKALGRYGKLLEDGTRKAADTTGNIWHHRTFPHILCF